MAPKKTLSLRPRTTSLDKLKQIANRAQGVQAVAAAASDVRTGAVILNIPLKDIVVEKQVRETFDDQSIVELAKSIESVGQQQPITVRMDNGRYILISGERRVRAMKHLGRETIMAILTKTDNPKEIKLRQLVENLQREDMNALEIGRSLESILEDGDYSLEQLSELIGKSRTYMVSVLSACKLPPEVADLVQSGVFSDISAIHRFVSLLAKEPENAAKYIGYVLKEAETEGEGGQASQITRKFIKELPKRLADEEHAHVVRPTMKPIPLKDIKLTPANAIRLARNSTYSHLHFPGLNLRYVCFFKHESVNKGEWYYGKDAQFIPSIITDNPDRGIVEWRGKLYECPWSNIQLVEVCPIDRNGTPLKTWPPKRRPKKAKPAEAPQTAPAAAPQSQPEAAGEDVQSE